MTAVEPIYIPDDEEEGEERERVVEVEVEEEIGSRNFDKVVEALERTLERKRKREREQEEEEREEEEEEQARQREQEKLGEWQRKVRRFLDRPMPACQCERHLEKGKPINPYDCVSSCVECGKTLGRACAFASNRKAVNEYLAGRQQPLLTISQYKAKDVVCFACACKYHFQ